MIEAILNRIIGFIVFVIIVAGVVYFGGTGYVKNRLEAGERTLPVDGFYIAKGSSFGHVISQLQNYGGFAKEDFPPSDDVVMLIGAKLGYIKPAFKAGEYNIPKGLSLMELNAYLSDSANIVQHFITFPEGIRSAEILERLRSNEDLTGILPEFIPEGRYLAETWSYEIGDTRQSILDRMEQAQDELLDQLWQTRLQGLPIKTKDEAVILASIVEKETGKAEERSLVASVYLNRLKKGMKLDADPSVAYGAGKFQGSQPLLRSDLLNANNLYNTYIHKGLPPGPIANPGEASLRAVLQPAESEYFFFVADGTGGHIFAKTYEEHKRNVARWRQIQTGKTTGQ